MLISWEPTTVLGTTNPVIRFGWIPPEAHQWGGLRMVFVDDDPAFVLSYPCGTCPILFDRVEGGPDHTLSLETMQQRLNKGLDDIDPAVVARFADLMPQGEYLVMLVEVHPELVLPNTNADYFTNEMPASWGADGADDARSADDAYYRTFETAIAPSDDDVGRVEGHLYEFVIPMVPPTWNDPDRVAQYRDSFGAATPPTAVAVSILDTPAPVRCDPDSDYYNHWGLMHFLLDGHHKMQAAAETGQPLRLLSLLATDQGLSSPDEVERLPTVRSQPVSRRR